MQTFAITGKYPSFTIKELSLLTKKTWVQHMTHVFVCEEKISLSLLGTLSSVIKAGYISPDLQIDKDLVGSTDEACLKNLKKEGKIKRYKITELLKSDLEIKKEGQEIFIFEKGGQQRYGIVEHYQNIDLYETIDFQKPYSGMNIGMMPAKLTHLLINIGTGIIGKSDTTVFDPFCGFGTTLFMANTLGYPTIGSDINIQQAKRNLTRRRKQTIQNNQPITILKNDVTDGFSKNILKKADIIVTEGRLGPKISTQLTPHSAYENQIKIRELYEAFLKNINKDMPLIPLVFTFPHYREQENFLHERIEDLLTEQNKKFEILPDIYHRKNQFVARRVVLVT